MQSQAFADAGAAATKGTMLTAAVTPAAANAYLIFIVLMIPAPCVTQGTRLVTENKITTFAYSSNHSP
ncbi:hypothetical protein C9F11_14645 [Streptomyces sp. YIM 121038]|nr:hypothetical protein C9F11_14645 [Streptomyces sp. YIM 121038]